MRKLIALLFFSTLLFSGDIITKPSAYSVDETIERIKTIVEKKGLDIFAVIDHQGNARQVNMKLQPSKMIIFGNPKMGTDFMQQDMRAGLDLPLRVLVYKDNNGSVQIVYRDGTWLKDHHSIDAPKLVGKLNGALDKITTRAGTKTK